MALRAPPTGGGVRSRGPRSSRPGCGARRSRASVREPVWGRARPGSIHPAQAIGSSLTSWPGCLAPRRPAAPSVVVTRGTPVTSAFGELHRRPDTEHDGQADHPRVGQERRHVGDTADEPHPDGAVTPSVPRPATSTSIARGHSRQGHDLVEEPSQAVAVRVPVPVPEELHHRPRSGAGRWRPLGRLDAVREDEGVAAGAPRQERRAFALRAHGDRVERHAAAARSSRRHPVAGTTSALGRRTSC